MLRVRGNPEETYGRTENWSVGTEIGAVRNEVGIPIKVLHAKKPIALSERALLMEPYMRLVV